MSYLENKIAIRYLFSGKGHHAIHIVTAISAVAIGVVTAAMICVLSVMNGFGVLVREMFSSFDPELKIVSVSGRMFVNPLADRRDIHYSEVLEGQALVEYKDHQTPVRLMGVDEAFPTISSIDSIITDGYYCVYDGAFDRAVLGRGLTATLGMNAHFVGGMNLYVPRRGAHVNMLRPDEAFRRATCFIAGEFAVNQSRYDDELMLVSLSLARQLFDADSTMVSALYVAVPEGYSVRRYQRLLAEDLGPNYRVLDQYEQQEDFYRILRIEKWLTALLLIFILVIAAFNIVGSLSMLIIDKQSDIRILSNLGLSIARIRQIFLLEGWLVSSLGAVSGLVLGIVVCLLQQHFGFLQLGDGMAYVISAYPVEVQAADVLLTLVMVLLLGGIAAWIPSRQITIEGE